MARQFHCIIANGLLAAGITAPVAAADLDRGHQLLLQYGYQLHAAPSPALAFRNPNGIDSTNLNVWRAANYNGLNFEAMNWDQQMWTPPTGNYNWSRWEIASTSSTNPSHVGMIMASVLEEQDLTDPDVVSTMASRLANIRTRTPNIIGYVNDAGPTNSLAAIENYMAIAQPDMLSFDHYVFAFGDPWIGGSPTPLYSHMGKYRTAALAGNNGDSTKPIPYHMWYQAFRVPGGQTLSESEMSVQYGAAWAYGYKALSAFRYSNEAANDPLQSVLFDGPNDSNPTSLYYTVARLNRQTQNLAPTLLRLKSVNLQFKRGRHKTGLFSSALNDLPSYTSDWSTATSGDPYMTSITVTNLGNLSGVKKNDGFAGDVIVGYFKPLLEEYDGASFNNQLYFMITNALTDAVGDRVDTRQQIRLNFNFGTSGINSLQRLDRETGLVLAVPLVATGGSNYYLDWLLYGGEGDLFKYNTGAPFVGQLSASWKADASGDWDAATNWAGNGVPNGIGAQAILGDVISSARTVYADTAITLGSLTFNSVKAYNLTGAASLSIQAAGGSGYIGVLAGSHKINLPLTFAGNTNINVASGGTLTLADPVTIKTGRTVSSTGLGTLRIQAPLVIEAGGMFSLAGAPAVLSGAPQLSAGARIDVGAQSLAINYSAFLTPAETIKAQLTSGYYDGEWTGEGIVTSAATSAQGLGWVDDSQSQSILIRHTWYGDANLSGAVDSSDFNALAAGYGQNATGIWATGDFNYDGKVNTVDFNSLAGNFGAGIPGLGAVVPEPAAGGLCLLAGLLRRWRSCSCHQGAIDP